MKKHFITLLFLVSISVQAQDPKPLTNGWKKSLVGTANVAQTNYHNWKESAGVNALTISGNINGNFENVGEKWVRYTNVKLGYGQIKQEGSDFEKALDEIYLEYGRTYRTKTKIQPTFIATGRSQFTNSYDATNSLRPKVSGLLAPAYLTQNLGVTYDPVAWQSNFIGVAAKQTIVNDQNLRTAFGVPVTDKLRNEIGLSTLHKLQKEILKNVTFKSQLGTFYAVTAPAAGKSRGLDMRWDNGILMKVNDFMQVSFEAGFLMDKDIDDKWQSRQLLNVGFLYKVW